MIRGLRPLVGLLGAAAIIAALPGAAPAAAAASQLVAVVIDFGPGGPAPLVKCVDVSGQGQVTDLTVVNEALRDAGDEQAGLCSNGLVYSLNAYPASGIDVCSDSSDLAYWAFFDGTSSGWSYSNSGPAFQLATPQTTIGWRYEPAGGATAPTEVADPAAQCPVAASVTPTTAPSAAPIAGSTTQTTQAGGGVALEHGVTTTTSEVPTKASTEKASAHEPEAARPPHGAVLAHPSSSAGGSGGSAVPTIIALGSFVLIAGGTAYVVRRRRAT